MWTVAPHEDAAEKGEDNVIIKIEVTNESEVEMLAMEALRLKDVEVDIKRGFRVEALIDQRKNICIELTMLEDGYDISSE